VRVLREALIDQRHPHIDATWSASSSSARGWRSWPKGQRPAEHGAGRVRHFRGGDQVSERTQVTIIGAGPAGLLLGALLHGHGVDTVILEARSREYCEARIRAGVLEQGTRDILVSAGVGERMEREGLIHGGIHLRFAGESHHVPMSELTGRSVTIYGQTEITKDLIAHRLLSQAPLHF
jgi:hypothetical protein